MEKFKKLIITIRQALCKHKETEKSSTRFSI